MKFLIFEILFDSAVWDSREGLRAVATCVSYVYELSGLDGHTVEGRWAPNSSELSRVTCYNWEARGNGKDNAYDILH